MPPSKPAFFQSDRFPRWRSLGAGVWVWVRLNFRHNPGFATAAAAGSIGLVLATVLLVRGDWRPWGAIAEPPAETVELGDASDSPPGTDEHPAATLKLTGGSGAPGNEGRGADERWTAGRNRQPARNDPLGDDDSSDETGPPVSRVSMSSQPIKRPRPSLDDDAQRDDSRNETGSEAAEDSPPLLASSDPPSERKRRGFALFEPDTTDGEEEEQDRRERQTSPSADESGAPGGDAENDEDKVSVADEGGTEASDEGSARPADPPSSEPTEAANPAARKPGLRIPPVGTVDEDEPEEPAPRASKPATTVIAPGAESASNERDSSDSESFLPPREGWNSSTRKGAASKQSLPDRVIDRPEPDRRQIEPAAAFTEGHGNRSPADTDDGAFSPRPPRAQPKPAVARPDDRAPVAGAANSPQRMTLEIRYPRNVTPGQTFDLEFVVRNQTRSPVERASLSVVLPPGLEHPLGPEVEQTIESLAACGTYRARLKVKAREAGEAAPRADVSVQGRSAAKCAAAVRISSPGGVRSTRLDPCDCAPIRYVW